MLCCGMDVAATGCLLGIKDGAFVVSSGCVCQRDRAPPSCC